MVIVGLAESLINFRGPLLRRLIADGHTVVACAPDASHELRERLSALGVEYRHVPYREGAPRTLPLHSAEQPRPHHVRPGSTGWAQVNGRNAIGWSEKLRLDVWYVDHRSVLLDFRILGMTVGRVFSRDGVNQPGHATAEPFRGVQSA